MANLKEIRSRIKSVKSIQKVTKAMKMVAAAKLRKSQENMERARPYSERLSNLISDLVDEKNKPTSELLTSRKVVSNIGFIIVTADRGLAGSFNTNIIKKAEQEIKQYNKENIKLFCIGKKGYEYFSKRGYTIEKYYVDFWNNLTFGIASEISNDVMDSFLNHSIDKAQVIYNYFKNVATQQIQFETFLPIQPLEQSSNKNVAYADVLYEPSEEELLTLLIPKHLNTQVWKYILESFASEQGSRMIAMENATENAGDMISDLTLEFNKARQTAITTEMLEIVGGAEALSN